MDGGIESSVLFGGIGAELCGGPENTQGPSVEENKLSEGGGMAKGFSYFYKSVLSWL